MSGVRFIVSGKVQGVFFRASTRNEAMRLGLHGHARNLSDGGVEVVASGSTEALRELEQWLWEGPPAAKVAEVTRSDYAGEVRAGFLVF
ncbi:acylphosphatase [Dyella flagellata]|uniref:acylphosphatase n=1 Tax=Dyella flagellata TaxID=1867833 RepID=A0ABQ5XAW7_9GAMM|nr:acylphosphatase [Dyella flagellata]GLQ88825.1 acylphosphatase [Dyella flagellata]